MSWNGKPTTVVVSRPDPERERASGVRSEVSVTQWSPEEVNNYLNMKYGRKLDRPVPTQKGTGYGW